MDIFKEESENAKWPTGTCCKTYIAILMAITLVIGIYFINTTVLIAKDGVLYIEIAKRIADNPIEAVRNAEQAPGYPFLIYLTHKAMGLFCDAQSLQGWIVSAQAVSILSKLIATITLYFVGGYFVGPRFSFWGVLILSVLPDSVDYGSDALTDWPHIMFLTIGFLLLLLGVQYRRRWIFGYAGIAAGLGYLIRSECCQVVLYGGMWFLFNLFRPQDKMKRAKATGALILLLAGFAVIAVPYMRFKGHVFPEQGIFKLSAVLGLSNDHVGSILNTSMCFAGLSVGGIIGNETLITNICETLIYYFIPALALGVYYYFRKQPKMSEQAFFIAAFIIVNVTIAFWQSCYRGPLSRRYTLPLVAFTIFYIPVGFRIIACWLCRNAANNDGTMGEKARRWLFILMMTGIGICAAKLVHMAPLRWEKQGYRDTAEWLNRNTLPADIIAVQDKRISFYAEREGMVYDEDIPGQANYAVRIVGYDETIQSLHGSNPSEGLLACWLIDEETGENVVDSSGNDNIAYLCGGVTRESGHLGNGLKLDGINGCVSAKLDVSETAYGVSLWFKTTVRNGGLFSVSRGEYGAEGNDRHIYLHDGNLSARIYCNEQITTVGLNLSDGCWHHVIHTYGQSISGQRLYVDGLLCASGFMIQSIFTQQDRIYIGYSNDSAAPFFKGNIDEVKVYNQVLRSDGQPETGYKEEYSALMNKLKRNKKKLAIYKAVH